MKLKTLGAVAAMALMTQSPALAEAQKTQGPVAETPCSHLILKYVQESKRNIVRSNIPMDSMIREFTDGLYPILDNPICDKAPQNCDAAKNAITEMGSTLETFWNLENSRAPGYNDGITSLKTWNDDELDEITKMPICRVSEKRPPIKK